MVGLGIGLGLSKLTPNKGGGYEAEARALFARFTTPPTALRKGVINRLITRLKTAGIWSRLDALWLMAAGDAQAARQNWITDAYNLTAVSSPTFTADRGYRGDGVAAHLRTGFTASAAARLLLDDAAIGAYVRAPISGAQRMIVGANDGTTAPFGYLMAVLNAGNAQVNVNSSSGGLFASYTPGVSAFVIGERLGSTTQSLILNGTKTDGAQNSIGRPSLELGLLCRDHFGTFQNFSPDELAMAFAGASLGAREPEFRAAVIEYLTAIGAN